MAVATQVPPHVLVFGADGSLESILGREGDGPGEFSWMSSVVALASDSLAVLDARPARLSVFTRAGTFVRGLDLSNAESAAGDVWPTLFRATDGSLVLFEVASFGAGRDVPLYRRSALSVVLDASGARLGTLGPFPGQEMFNAEWGFGAAFYGAGTFADVVGDALVVGDSDRSELRWYAFDGTLRRIARWPSGLRRLSAEGVDSLVEGVVASAPAERRVAFFRRQMAEMPLPDSVPALADVFASDVGEVWVGDYPGALATKGMARSPARSWLVFSADGTLVAEAETPAGFQS